MTTAAFPSLTIPTIRSREEAQAWASEHLAHVHRDLPADAPVWALAASLASEEAMYAGGGSLSAGTAAGAAAYRYYGQDALREEVLTRRRAHVEAHRAENEARIERRAARAQS